MLHFTDSLFHMHYFLKLLLNKKNAITVYCQYSLNVESISWDDILKRKRIEAIKNLAWNAKFKSYIENSEDYWLSEWLL